MNEDWAHEGILYFEVYGDKRVPALSEGRPDYMALQKWFSELPNALVVEYLGLRINAVDTTFLEAQTLRS